MAITKKQAIKELTTGILTKFMSKQQRSCIYHLLNSEEDKYFLEAIERILFIIRETPKTYETRKVTAKDKIVRLHYFYANYDAWIVERDLGDEGQMEPAGEGEQIQAYGLASFFGVKESEWGYISIQEIIENGGELDLNFVPKTVAELKA